jgi:hypothetical protein
MLGKKERGYDIAGMGSFYIGTAHAMEEGNAVIAGDAHNHAIIEQAKSRTLAQGGILGIERYGRR